MRTLYLILTAIIGYCLGSINGAIIAGFFVHHKDVRRYGSRNAGLTNYYRNFGTPGLVVLVLIDVLKAVIAVLIGGALMNKVDAKEVGMLFAGFCVILGHMFPAALRFRGGKGLASLGGVILSWDWRAFLALLALAILIAFMTNYICFVAPTMSLLFPALYYWRSHDLPAALVLFLPAAPILWKHLENFRRIRAGTEVRMSYLWNKDGELRRTGRA